MKSFAFFVLALFIAYATGAQESPFFTTDHCGKLTDVIAAYEKAHPDYNAPRKAWDSSEVAEEDEHFQFGRAVWYWQRHLDAEGYMVSDMQRWSEWERIKNSSSGNKMAKTTGNRASWVFQGPDKNDGSWLGDVGRTNHLTFHPTDSNTFWVGTPYSGAWKTINNGASWTCMTDGYAITGVSEIVINRLRAATVYIAGPLGVLKSFDGGATWATTGFTYLASDYKSIGTMVMSAYDTSVLLLSARDGVYRTANSGATWTKVLPLNCYRIICHPQNPKLLFAGSFSTGYGATFSSGQIFRSADNGVTWNQVSNFTAANSIELAVSSASPRVVKAVTANYAGGLDGIFTSSDTGRSFRPIFTNPGGCGKNLLASDTLNCDGQGGYCLAIAISPVDTNTVYLGGYQTCVSTDGGYHWKFFNTSLFPGTGNFVIHPDIHYIGYNPVRPSRLYICSDGGIVKTESAASGVWTDITTGLGIGELYNVDVSSRASYQLAGLQDCGVKVVRGYSGAISPVYGGDGTTARIDWADSTTFYAGTQNGLGLNRIKSAGGAYTTTDIRMAIPGAGFGAANWITPLLVHPINHDTIIVSYNGIALSGDRGDHWTSITNNLPNAQYVSVMAMSPTDGQTIYAVQTHVVINGLSIYSSSNLGKSWTPISFPFPYSGSLSDLKIDPKDKTHFWVSFSGYGSIKMAEYKSGIWKDVSANLPDVPVNCIAIDTFSGELYVGTDVSVFLYNKANSQWDLYNKNLPVVMVNGLSIDYRRNEIWAATFGRSLWKSAKNTINPTGVSIGPAHGPVSLALSPNPGSGRFVLDGGNAFAGMEATFRVVDIAGRTVWQATQHFDLAGKAGIDVTTLAKGTYTVEIVTNGTQVGVARLSLE